MSDRLQEAKQYYDFDDTVLNGMYDIGLGRWLISELEQSRAELKQSEEAEALIMEWKDWAEKQRRHRKWALKKARSYLHNPCATVVYAGGEGRMRVMGDKDE